MEPASPERIVALVGSGVNDATLLEALEDGARDIIASGLAYRLYPIAERLRSPDYRNQPWAALLAGNVVGIVQDRAIGRRCRQPWIGEPDEVPR